MLINRKSKAPPAAPSPASHAPSVPVQGQYRTPLNARTTITPPTIGGEVVSGPTQPVQSAGYAAPPQTQQQLSADPGLIQRVEVPQNALYLEQLPSRPQPQAPTIQHYAPNANHDRPLDISTEGLIPTVSGPVTQPQDDVMQYTPSSENFWSGVKGVFSLVVLVATAFLLAGAINRFVFQSYQVFGKSMQTTLATDDRLIVSKLGKSFRELIGSDHVPQRHEVVVFDSPKEPGTQLVKRVIGLPGERVVVVRGIITVFNEDFPDGFNPDVDDSYADDLPSESLRTGDIAIDLADDEIFVAGDNRTAGSSLDSRNSLGPVNLDDLIGSVVLRIFPLAESRTF